MKRNKKELRKRTARFEEQEQELGDEEGAQLGKTKGESYGQR
jgi:hypothetical protein